MRFDKGQNAYYLCLRLILSCHGHCTGAVVTCTSVHKALRALSATSLPGSFLTSMAGLALLHRLGLPIRPLPISFVDPGRHFRAQPVVPSRH